MRLKVSYGASGGQHRHGQFGLLGVERRNLESIDRKEAEEGKLSHHAEQRIGTASLEQVDAWLLRVLSVSSVADLLAE